MQVVAALIWGLVFGAGLAIAGMTNPAKVLAFLDVAGAWDPTLAFVMGGALLVNAGAYALTRRRAKPLFAEVFALPTRRDLDLRLVGGAALFGVGGDSSASVRAPRSRASRAARAKCSSSWRRWPRACSLSACCCAAEPRLRWARATDPARSSRNPCRRTLRRARSGQ
jgi:hypothetical protein